MSDQLWQWSATALARGIRTRQISSVEAVTACVERAEEVNPSLNAIVESTAEKALEAARVADSQVGAGEALASLHGVPITIKVNANEVGHATTNGVAALGDVLATTDDPQVEAFRAAGAISIGRTNTPAFSFRWFTENELYGKTVNPRNPALSPGGSSGGAGAAVAAGIGPIGHANDIGGSIRFPAACCGVVGLRPTFGRIAGWYGSHDLAPHLGIQLMLVQGAITRTIEDARLSLDVLAKDDRRDPLFVPAKTEFDDSTSRPRVGVVLDPGQGFSTAPTGEVKTAVETAAGWLSDAGYPVEEVEAPMFGEASRLWWPQVMTEFSLIRPMVEEIGGEGINTFLNYVFDVMAAEFGTVTLEDYIEGYAQRLMLLRSLQEFQEHYPILLTPVAAERPFAPGEDVRELSRTRELMDAMWPMMSVPFLGVPALSVPVSTDESVPLSVQLIGPRFRESDLLQIGEVIESRSPVSSPIDPVRETAGGAAVGG